MAKYLFEAHYTADGAKGLAREGGTGRRLALAKMAEAVRRQFQLKLKEA